MADSKNMSVLKARLQTLETELGRTARDRDQAKHALDAAQSRITELEDARDQALNRIDWAIDSIHNVLDVSN